MVMWVQSSFWDGRCLFPFSTVVLRKGKTELFSTRVCRVGEVRLTAEAAVTGRVGMVTQFRDYLIILGKTFEDVLLADIDCEMSDGVPAPGNND